MGTTQTNSINQSGASGISNFNGTATFSTTPLTQFNVLSGASSDTINNIPPVTAGFVLTSNGASAQPSFQLPAITGALIYYWTNTASSVASELQQTAAQFSPKTTQTFTTIGSGITALEIFITNAGVPNLSFLPAGTYIVHLHSNQTAGSRNVGIYAEIWEASSTGVDIALIGTTGTTTNLTVSEIEYQVSFSLANTYTFGSTASRIKTKLFASGAVPGSDATVNIFVGGTADSHTTLPGPTADVTNFVPYTGAVSNVNLGTNTITAQSATLTTALTVPNGGTGLASTTAYGVICGGTTSTGNLQNAGTGAVTSTVLIGNGSGALPSFSATPQLTGLGIGAASTGSGLTFDGSSTLSIFSEGTFTPVIRGSGTAGTPTYVRQLGYYQKIGNWVRVTVDLSWSALSSATGTLQMTGLPFTSQNVTGYITRPAEGWGTDSQALASGSGNIPQSPLNPNNNLINLFTYSQTGGGQNAQALSASGSFVWSLTYKTA